MVSGLALLVIAAAGYLVTFVAMTFAAQPSTTENLTAVWKANALGDRATVDVPDGDTLVAIAVGTQLTGIAGTTTGNCRAERDDVEVGMSWPVQLEWQVDGELRKDQQGVVIAGWTNDTGAPTAVDITCASADSGVDYFVAVPSRTAQVPVTPWFQPWAWVALAVVGVGSLVGAVLQAYVRPGA